MPSHWGHTRAEHRPRLERHRDAGAARGRRAPKPASIYQPRRRHPRSRVAVPRATRSSTPRSAKARRAKASSGRRSTPPARRRAAGAVSRRRQRLRHLGAGRSRRRRAATSRASCGRSPVCTSTSVDGTDFFASLRAMREAAAYVRARKGPALVHARVIRPYSHSLSDDEKLYKTPAEREAEARRDPITRFAEFLRAQRPGDGRRARGDRRRDRARDRRSRARSAESAAAGRGARAALWVYSPDVDPTSAAFEHGGRARGQARHDGRGHQPHAEGRDGARPAHRRLRRGRRRCEPRGGAGGRVAARAASSR